MLIKMRAELADAGGQQRDMDFRRTGIALAAFVFVDNGGFLLCR
jgi:hypothetical protein